MYPLSGDPDSLFLCRDISFVLRTHEISLHKQNSPGSADKDTPLTGSCYTIRYKYTLDSIKESI